MQSTVQQAVAPDFFSEDGTPASTEQLVTEVILPRGGVGALIQRGGRAVAGMLTIATAGGS